MLWNERTQQWECPLSLPVREQALGPPCIQKTPALCSCK
jgi:hypothetical protein